MDFDSYYEHPDTYQRGLDFDLTHTSEEGVVTHYTYDDGVLSDEKGNELTFTDDSELSKVVRQTLWLYTLPEEPRFVELGDGLDAVFGCTVRDGIALWEFNFFLSESEEGEGYGDEFPATKALVERAYQLLGNPFIDFNPNHNPIPKTWEIL